MGGLAVKEVIATTVWFISWHCREIKHNGLAPTPSRLALSIKAMVPDGMKARKKHKWYVEEGLVQTSERQDKIEY
jgi:hypothetical protein